MNITKLRSIPFATFCCCLGVLLLCGCHTNERTATVASTVSPPATSASHKTMTVTTAENDWTAFRGERQGIVNSQLPNHWSESEGLIWKSDLPGGGSSTPLVFGDRIYVTSYSGYQVPGADTGSLSQLRRHLTCLNLTDGTIIWDQTIQAEQPEPETIRDHGYAANTGAVDSQHIYVFLGKSGVIAFDHEGNQVWKTSVGTGTNGWGTGSSLLLFDDLVIVNASVESESVIALERTTGKLRWKKEGIKESWSSPLIGQSTEGRQELIVPMFGKILGLNPETGAQYWQCDSDITWYMVPAPVTADGVVYCMGGRSGTSALAVRLGGTGDVTNSHRLWTSKKGTNVCSPVLIDGRLYWCGDQSGIAYCADAESGELIYEERLSRCDQVYASAIATDGAVYYLDRSGNMFVVATEPEFRLLYKNSLSDGTRFNASPAVAKGHLLLRSEKAIYCIGK